MSLNLNNPILEDKPEDRPPTKRVKGFVQKGNSLTVLFRIAVEEAVAKQAVHGTETVVHQGFGSHPLPGPDIRIPQLGQDLLYFLWRLL